jgi:hemoglobin
MSIYESIGGADAVRVAVDDFYVRVLGDPSLAPYFTGTDMARLKAHQRAFITAALGGPQAYEGKSMSEAHEGRDITPEAFASVVGHLVATLEGLGVDGETIATIGGALAPLEPEIVTVQTA